jgi:hypothetical protein
MRPSTRVFRSVVSSSALGFVWSLALILVSLSACGKKDSGTAASAASAGFEVAQVPLAKAPLPEFPFVEWPDYVDAGARQVEAEAALDALPVIAGAQLLTVEGRLERRVFSIPSGKSTLELRRYYQDRINAFGGVQVNTLQPVNDAAVVVDVVRNMFPPDADPAKRLGLQRYDEGQYQYQVYLARTETTNAWIIVQTSTYSVVVTSIAANAK